MCCPLLGNQHLYFYFYICCLMSNLHTQYEYRKLHVFVFLERKMLDLHTSALAGKPYPRCCACCAGFHEKFNRLLFGAV